jgi:hypothetical protein
MKKELGFEYFDHPRKLLFEDVQKINICIDLYLTLNSKKLFIIDILNYRIGQIFRYRFMLL